MRKVFKNEEEKKRFIADNCPSDCGIPDSDCTISCEKCWSRDGIELVIEEKENKEMAVKRNLTAEEVIENLQKQIAELQEEQKKLERYKGYQDTADEIAAMRAAFVVAGFSDEEAFTMVSGMVDKVIGAAVRKML